MYAINHSLVIPVRAYTVRTYGQLNTPWMWHWCVQYRCTHVCYIHVPACVLGCVRAINYTEYRIQNTLRITKTQLLSEAGEPAYRPAYEHRIHSFLHGFESEFIVLCLHSFSYPVLQHDNAWWTSSGRRLVETCYSSRCVSNWWLNSFLSVIVFYA